MKKNLPLFAMLSLASVIGRAAPATPAAAADDPLGGWAKALHLSLRQGIADKNTVEKPANFQWVHSAGDDSSSSIDLGLTFRLFDDDRWNVAPAAEYHKQTLASKKQDNFQGGLTVYNIWGDITEGLTAYNQGTFTWKDDRINTGSGGLYKVTTTLLDPREDIGLGSAVGWLRFLWQPTFGLQYESAENVRKSGQSGHTGRLYGNLEAAFYPFGKKIRDRLEIVVRETVWRNVSASSAFARLYDRRQTLFNATATYYFDDPKHVGLGLDYQQGENPEQGLKKQETTTLALKLKI